MRDRKVKQAGLRGARVSGKYAPYAKVATAECVVIAVRFIDDIHNRSKAYVEYDVRDLRTGQIYNNCRRLDSGAGMEDGVDNTLRPAQRNLGTASPVFDPKIAQLSQSDGDRVLVSFSYGAQHGATITDVLPHPKQAYGATKADGFRRLQTHRGTSIETKSDGSFFIKRGDTVITIAVDETIEVKHKSGSRLRFLENGDVDVVPKRDLLLGDERAALAVARATDPVQVTIPPGVVLVATPGGPAPNPAPIPLTGTIQNGSANVKG